MAVNGSDYDPDVLKDTVTAAKTDKSPIQLLVKDFSDYETIDVDYHGGLQYPKLERIKGRPDYLSQVLAALKWWSARTIAAQMRSANRKRADRVRALAGCRRRPPAPAGRKPARRAR